MRLAGAYLCGLIALGTMAQAKSEEKLALPSGLEAHLQEMLWDRPGSGLVYRFRFVAPAFSPETADFDIMLADLEYLCNEHALPKISNVGPSPSQVIISLSDRESEFGVFDPEVKQVFEAYSVADGLCIWEVY